MASQRNRGVFRVSVCGQEEIEQLSRDGSHYSLSTGVLPSLGARSNRRVKLRRFIVSPYDRRYRCFFLFSWLFVSLRVAFALFFFLFFIYFNGGYVDLSVVIATLIFFLGFGKLQHWISWTLFSTQTICFLPMHFCLICHFSSVSQNSWWISNHFMWLIKCQNDSFLPFDYYFWTFCCFFTCYIFESMF